MKTEPLPNEPYVTEHGSLACGGPQWKPCKHGEMPEASFYAEAREFESPRACQNPDINMVLREVAPEGRIWFTDGLRLSARLRKCTKVPIE
jgi:hypothetical protein